VRRLHAVPLVAVSGSSGKTTTKEMIAAILERSRRVLKTEGNMNNLVGLPLTLLGLESFHEAVVVELGISEASEMERLVEISAPDVALITNIGSGHLETLGTPEGVARAKAPLFTALGPGCTRVVNLDDPLVKRLAGQSTASGGMGTVTYGTDSGADVVVTKHMVPGDLKGIDAVYEVRGVSVDVRFASPAICNVINGAAAIAATLALGSSIEDIRAGLHSFAALPGRMEVLRAGSLTLLDDTYNANPESVEAALKTLGFASGRKVAVLGEMLELGHASAVAHRDAGRAAGHLGVDLLVAIGPMSRETAEGGISSGLDARNVYSFDDKEEALKALKGLVKAGDSVLVKGSRGAALEEVVRALKNLAELGNAYG
jgi:UDP-N-acetylmuramoyl-tripeptide--D-alanyl-D-alanine ligase